MQVVFIILFLAAKLSSVKCDDDCSEKHPKNCPIDGTLTDPNLDKILARGSEIFKPIKYDITKYTIPENFDSRTAWPKCRNVIGKIKAQGRCNNCWSYCSTMIFADRVCIASNGTDNEVEFSIVDLNNCCPNCLGNPKQSPCNYGGYINHAFEYAVNEGIVFEKCKPFDPVKLVASCENKCVDKKKKIKNNRHKGTKGVWADKHPDPNLIKIEIMTNGPVCGHLENLTTDFLGYWGKKAMFIPVRPINIPKTKTGHSVRIIGWGVENKIAYWLIANSWGITWADNGVVKLPAGLNDFAVDEKFFAVLTGPLTEAERDRASSFDLPSTKLLIIIYLFGRLL